MKFPDARLLLLSGAFTAQLTASRETAHIQPNWKCDARQFIMYQRRPVTE